MDFSKLKPKPMERDNKIHVPDNQEKIGKTDKPELDIKLIEEVAYYIKTFYDYTLDRAVKSIIPNWVWIILVVGVFVALLLSMAL